jgi:hypothetical protein
VNIKFDNPVSLFTVGGINQQSWEEKRNIYSRLIPVALYPRFNLTPDLIDENGHDLLFLNCPPGGAFAEMELYHQAGFVDPILYGQITDTINGQVHVLLYIINDPSSPRFDIDSLPDGTPTKFGTLHRNIEAEIQAMQFGLAPGQIRRGLRILPSAVQAFELFVGSLGQELYFVEPLYYHNAVIFERHGFNYQQGRKLMQRIQDGFKEGGDLLPLLDYSSPFRTREAANSIRLRSWAIHDNLLGEPFLDVTMYKWIGKSANLNSAPNCSW